MVDLGSREAEAGENCHVIISGLVIGPHIMPLAIVAAISGHEFFAGQPLIERQVEEELEESGP